MAENLEISNFFLTKVKFKVKKYLDNLDTENEEKEGLPIFSERFENLDPPCFSCKRDKSMDMVLSLFQSEGYDGSFELDIALPSDQRFEIVDLHDLQISLFEKNESKLATFNQKFPENLGLREEPDCPDHEDELVKDVFTFKINDILKIFTNEEIQDKFEYAEGHILVSYKSLGPKVNGLTAINKIYGDQAEETVPVLKLPDSEDEHNEDDTERNVEVAKVKRSLQILFELIFVKLKILLFTENFRFGISSEDVFQNECQLHH